MAGSEASRLSLVVQQLALLRLEEETVPKCESLVEEVVGTDYGLVCI